MIHTHFEPLLGAKWGTGGIIFHPLTTTGTGVREWTFLPPMIAMWCRADGSAAVQVRDNTQIIAKSITIGSLCNRYQVTHLGAYRWAATIVEADPGEYTPGNPVELVHDKVARIAGCPVTTDLFYTPGGWATSLSMIAYGGNNDGAVCGRIALNRFGAADHEEYFLPSPGILRIDRYFSSFNFWRMDWTGGANWATIDVYISERVLNTEIA